MTTIHSPEVYDLYEFKSGLHIPVATLRHWLPDVETALFFAKVYELDYVQLSSLLSKLFNTGVVAALLEGDHSLDLQDYLVDVIPDSIWTEKFDNFFTPDATPPAGEILPQMWESLTITIAESIKEVGEKLKGSLSLLPSKEGTMLFGHMAQMNKVRNTIGDYRPFIKHTPVPDVLVVLDVSGSVTEDCVREIADDVVALSYNANAHLAIVSNNAYHWEPGSFNVQDVLDKAEYGGTRYEMLKPLFDRDWGTVITIADYDSSASAKRALARCTGRIGKVLDISLVSRPSYLSECVGQLADEVQPLLIARNVISYSYGW